MREIRQRRGWVLIAAIAIGFALLLMLAPHGHSGAADFVAILPLLRWLELSRLSACWACWRCLCGPGASGS
jgi:hypothetical protein